MEGKWVAEWGPNEFGETEFVYLDHMKVGLMSAVGIRGVIGALHADGHFLCPQLLSSRQGIGTNLCTGDLWGTQAFEHPTPHGSLRLANKAFGQAMQIAASFGDVQDDFRTRMLRGASSLQAAGTTCL